MKKIPLILTGLAAVAVISYVSYQKSAFQGQPGYYGGTTASAYPQPTYYRPRPVPPMRTVYPQPTYYGGPTATYPRPYRYRQDW